MVENNSDRSTSYEVMKTRERAAMQREAFRRTHGVAPAAHAPKLRDSLAQKKTVGGAAEQYSNTNRAAAAQTGYGYADDPYADASDVYGYSYQPGYVDPSKKLYPEQRVRGGSMPVLALILGVVSILIFWTMPLAMLIALAGIIMSVHVIGKNNDKGLGMAALITSIIGMILALILTGFVIMNSARLIRAFDEVNDMIIEEYGEEFDEDLFGNFEGLSELLPYSG